MGPFSSLNPPETKKRSKLSGFCNPRYRAGLPRLLDFQHRAAIFRLLSLGISLVLLKGSEKHMIRPSWRLLLIGVVTVAVLSLAIPQASAQCWGCRPAYGWGYCYTPCSSCFATVGCGSCCGDAWYLGCRPGPIRRLLFGPYRWYWGGYWGGGCGGCSSGWYSGCCGGCTTCGTSCCGGAPRCPPASRLRLRSPSTEPAPMEPTPAAPAPVTPAPTAPAPIEPVPRRPPAPRPTRAAC